MSRHLTLQDLESNTRAENRLIQGRVVVSTNRRDLVWPMNGDDAMRVMKVFVSRGSKSGWGDTIDPLTSEARHGWTAWRNAKVVAMHWEPDWDATCETVAQTILDAGPDVVTAIGLLTKLRAGSQGESDLELDDDREDDLDVEPQDQAADTRPDVSPDREADTVADLDAYAAEGDGGPDTAECGPPA